MNNISSAKYFSLFSGIIFLIVGIYVIVSPLFISGTINIILCVLLLIEGISQISAYMSEKREGRSIWRLIEGILSVAAGIYFAVKDSLGLPIAFIVAAGIWLLLVGISRVFMGMRVVKFEKNPVFVAGYISVLFGISLIVQAVVAIFRFFRLNRMERKLK